MGSTIESGDGGLALIAGGSKRGAGDLKGIRLSKNFHQCGRHLILGGPVPARRPIITGVLTIVLSSCTPLLILLFQQSKQNLEL